MSASKENMSTSGDEEPLTLELAEDEAILSDLEKERASTAAPPPEDHAAVNDVNDGDAREDAVYDDAAAETKGNEDDTHESHAMETEDVIDAVQPEEPPRDETNGRHDDADVILLEEDVEVAPKEVAVNDAAIDDAHESLVVHVDDDKYDFDQDLGLANGDKERNAVENGIVGSQGEQVKGSPATSKKKKEQVAGAAKHAAVDDPASALAHSTSSSSSDSSKVAAKQKDEVKAVEGKAKSSR